MTMTELDNYRQNIVRNFGAPNIIIVNEDVMLLNVENTDNRHAHGGVSWINYWRSIAGKYAHVMCCSSCGKELFVGEPTFEQKVDWELENETIEEHEAQGGHVWWYDCIDARRTGLYITPLCPACNGKHGQRIPIRAGSILCREVGANVTTE